MVVAGLYAILAPILHHLINLTDRVSKLESKMDILIGERVEKKLAGTPA